VKNQIAFWNAFFVSAGTAIQLNLAAAETARITVDMDQPGHAVPATLHGLFFEDINYGGDGGLYAELVQNRSFEDQEPLYNWSEAAKGGAAGRLSVVSESPLNAANPHFLRIYVSNPGTEGYGTENTGFDGIALRKGDDYFFSIYAHRRAGDSAALNVALRDANGNPLAGTIITNISEVWQKFETKLTSPATVTNARLVVLAANAGVVDVDMISLFPGKTFKGRRNGLRADLAQAMADVHPGFLRFPGGCIVQGRDMANAYRWKDTIGDVAERKQNWNFWRDARSPEYDQTFGLGFFEYFQLCEDIGAEPVPVINCGMCFQGDPNTPVPLDQLGPFVQDALDLIEFANGGTNTTWGAQRAAMGHPTSFDLKFLAIGNEQWQQVYFDRYDIFYRAIKAKYPQINIICSAGPFPGDANWRFAWNQLRTGSHAEVVDEHYYSPPQWFYENMDRYDNYDRNGPKVFVGEYAARGNNLRAALAEAAYMTSLWKNSDEVLMASYAPLFAKFGHDQWHPDLIWFDNTRVLRTPNYFVQQQFARNRPDVYLPTTVEASTILPHPAGLIGVGTWKTQAEYKDLRVTAPDGRVLFESDFSNGFGGWKTSGGDWKVMNGALRQTAGGENLRAVVGDPAWSDYTLTLKARKLGGSEGFLILFHTPEIENPVWWNLGGWGNTEHSLQGGDLAEDHVRGSIETGRWYDIRIELRNGKVRAYLDGKLIHEVNPKPIPVVYAAAGRDNRAGELILQMVNPFSEPTPVNVKLNGAVGLGGKARTITLANPSPDAENTFDNPNAIAPQMGEFSGVAPEFSCTLPPHSLTTFRIPEK
jgi:alpha-L-arabinofuranosidase